MLLPGVVCTLTPLGSRVRRWISRTCAAGGEQRVVGGCRGPTPSASQLSEEGWATAFLLYGQTELQPGPRVGSWALSPTLSAFAEGILLPEVVSGSRLWPKVKLPSPGQPPGDGAHAPRPPVPSSHLVLGVLNQKQEQCDNVIHHRPQVPTHVF